MFARRVHGWTAEAFPIGTGTGAVYLILSSLQHRPRFLPYLETAFFLLAVLIFLFNTTTLLLQAILYPRRLWRHVRDPHTGACMPLLAISFATLVVGTIAYGVPGGYVSPGVVHRLFWAYIALALVVSWAMLMVWFSKPHDSGAFTPTWAFPVFPLMLVGMVASNVLRVLPPADVRALGVLLVGFFFQGLGFLTSFFYIGMYLARIMATGFLPGRQAASAFVACAPPGFTALSLLSLGQHAQAILPHYDIAGRAAGDVWYAASVLGALMLFGLAVFLFLLAALPFPFKLSPRLADVLPCWALTFPNVGWLLALRALSSVLHLPLLSALYTALALALCAAWAALAALTARAVWRGDVFCSSAEAVARDAGWSARAGVGEESGRGRERARDWASVTDVEKGHGLSGESERTACGSSERRASAR